MWKRLPITGFLIALLAAPWAGAGGQFKSGPQPGETVPGSFGPFNINGKYGKKMDGGETVDGRHHCLVCEYELRPVIAVFAREPKDDKLLMDLLTKIDQVLEKDKDLTGRLRGFVVFLSPYGIDSVIESSLPEDKKVKDPEKLVEIAIERKGLLNRLYQRAAQFKNLIVAYYPDAGPEKYKIDPKAEITILLYENFKVQTNFAFQSNQLTPVSVEQIMKAVNTFAGNVKKESSH